MNDDLSYFGGILMRELESDQNVKASASIFSCLFFRLVPRKIRLSSERGNLIVWFNHVKLDGGDDLYLTLYDRSKIFWNLKKILKNRKSS